MAKLLIIGGTGFFGKSILDAFQKGQLAPFDIDHIILLARSKQKFVEQNADLLSNDVELVEGDISHMQTLPQADVIIYAAASTNIQDYKENGNVEVKKMQDAIENFCKLILQYGEGAKVVFCSSGAVYGKQPLDLEKIDETFPLPIDVSNVSQEYIWYLEGKRFAEEQFKKLGKSNKKVAIARCFSFSGKYLPKDQHYALGNFIGNAEKGQAVVVEAAGIVYRSYMEADYLVKSLLLIGNEASPACPIFNVGSDKQVSIYDLASKIAKKYSVPCEFKNLNEGIVIDRYVPNVDKLKKLFRKSK